MEITRFYGILRAKPKASPTSNMERIMSKIVQLASLSSLVLSACLISACSDGDKNDADHTPKSGSILVPQVTTSNANVKFGIDIQNNTCSDKGDGKIGTVTWTVSDPGIAHVKVMAGTQEFTYAGDSGKEVTGPWVSKATTFSLLDAATGKQLADLKVVAQPCKF